MPSKLGGPYHPQQNQPPISLPPSEAQSYLSTFLTLSYTHPHLHPNSKLSNLGITFAANTGPSGGLVLHQLKRIEAGLRGEFLEPETREELEAKFGAEELGADPEAYENLPAVSSSRKNGRRGRGEGRMNDEEIGMWSDNVGYEVGREIESFANTPLYTPMHEGADGEGWRELREGEGEQEPWQGEMGGDTGGQAMGEVVGGVPEVVVEGRTEVGKEERKRRKKAKREEERRRKAREREGG